MTGTRTLGAVPAGGRSRRFGSDKALASFLGEPLVLRPARALEAVCRDVVLVGRGDGALDAIPYRVVADRLPRMGPLGGLHAALLEARAAGDEAVLLLGGDMPLVTPGMLRRVASEGRRCRRLAAAPVGARRGLEPLCAWYSTDCLETVERRLEGPDRSLHGLLEELDAHAIPVADEGAPAALASANTPDELARLETLAMEAMRR